MSLIRILHVINGELYSGAERVQDLLALRLPDYGYEVGFACVKPDLFPEQRMAQTAPLYRIPMASRFDLGCARSVARVVRDEGYALIHTHSPRAALIGRLAALMTGVPMVHHVHSPTLRDTGNRLRNRINAFTERLSLTGVDRLIPVSASLHRYLRELGYADTRLIMVANGVPTPGPLSSRPAPVGPWIVGCVALFRPRKGLEILVSALARWRDAGVPVRLRAVGGFETLAYEQQIKTQAATLGVTDLIDWVGFTRNVNAEFERMDVFVLPSLFGEGLPMVILEAMATGVPVVASNVEGACEAIEDGVSGLLVAPADVGSLADAVLALVQGRQDWQAMRAAAYARQREHFSDHSMAEGVAKVYAEVLKLG